MIDALIVDDEPAAREALQGLLRLYTPQVRVIGTCKSVAEAEAFIAEQEPDLIFLDIVMPKSYGFNLLEKITGKNIQVIFTTAHDGYAIRAFKTSAIDFLLKPINPQELIAAIQKAREQHTLIHSNSQLELLKQNLKGDDPKLALSTTEGYLFLRLSEIIYLEASSNYTCIHLMDGRKEMVARTLGEFEDPLLLYPFIRVHRSYIVNLAHVRKMVKGNNILMANTELVPLSPGRKEDFLNQFLSMK